MNPKDFNIVKIETYPHFPIRRSQWKKASHEEWHIETVHTFPSKHEAKKYLQSMMETRDQSIRRHIRPVKKQPTGKNTKKLIEKDFS